MKLRKCVIVLIFIFLLSGCATTQPVVIWKDRDVAFAQFKTFDIMVFETTGMPINKAREERLAFLVTHLNKQFKLQNLKLNDAPQNKTGVLIVQNEIVIFATSHNEKIGVYPILESSRTVYCALRTRLIDKSTSNLVAEISITTQAGEGLPLGVGAEKKVLKKSAAAIAERVARIIRTKEPNPGGALQQNL